MGATGKKYNTLYKKKIDVFRDSFIPRKSLKEIVQCAGCGSFYHRRHWTLVKPAGFVNPIHPHLTYCPACRKIKAHSASGELHLLGVGDADRGEVLRLLRNEEGKAREKNPLDRIIRLEKAADDWKVETTTEKLAQRLGRSVRNARGGRLAFKWSHNNKFVRVVWEGRGALPHGETGELARR